MVKGKRFLSILAAAVILAMLIAAIPANLCFAITGDESVTLDPTSGAIDDDVDIEGTDFEDGESVDFYFSSESASVGEYIDTDVENYEVVLETDSDSYGEIYDSFSVPDTLTDGNSDEDVEDGTYYVYAVYHGDDEIVTRDTFHVSSGGGTGDESISVLPTSAGIDDWVEIEGTDFEADETVYFYFSKESARVGDEIDSDVSNYEKVESADATSSGYVDGNFYVPDTLTDGDEDEDVVGGTYYVYAAYYGDKEIVAKDSITITATEISLSPTKGKVGTRVTITGSGFDNYESIDITFGSTSVDIDSGDDETDSSGDFTSYITVPEAAKGSQTVTVEIGDGEGEASFTVEPDIEIDPEDGGVNERVTVTGTGFAKNGNISITFDGDDVATGSADSHGSFTATFNVPEVTPGTYEIKADTAKASFTISTSVSISPTTSATSPGYVGDEITISGTGFKGNSDITITYESTPVEVATVTSESDGSFEATFKVPASQHGEHTITADDGTSSMSVKFYMESTPPDTPPPLQPYMNGKAKSRAYFDWEDVTANVDGVVEQSLPITYELQVATDENFTNPLLDIKGIETSEYTLTEEEALEKTSEEIPAYYWRLRAVDAASNASQWTGTGIFTLGFSFDFLDFSGWLLYVLIGIGALLLFFVGFWIGGRRGGGGGYY
jgi:hypothetical protein